jgi:hypothetical protein
VKRKKIIIHLKQEQTLFFTITSSCRRLGQEDREEKSNLLFVFYRIEANMFFFNSQFILMLFIFVC